MGNDSSQPGSTLHCVSFSTLRHLVSLLAPVGTELLRPGRRLTVRRLLLSTFNSSLAFFLCSFQVCICLSTCLCTCILSIEQVVVLNVSWTLLFVIAYYACVETYRQLTMQPGGLDNAF